MVNSQIPQKISQYYFGLPYTVPPDVLPDLEGADEPPLDSLDIEVNTVRPVSLRGSTKKFHLHTGDEGVFSLAEACLPNHTRRWYRQQMEMVEDALWETSFKQRMALFEALRRSFDDLDAEPEPPGVVV